MTFLTLVSPAYDLPVKLDTRHGIRIRRSGRSEGQITCVPGLSLGDRRYKAGGAERCPRHTTKMATKIISKRAKRVNSDIYNIKGLFRLVEKSGFKYSSTVWSDAAFIASLRETEEEPEEEPEEEEDEDDVLLQKILNSVSKEALARIVYKNKD